MIKYLTGLCLCIIFLMSIVNATYTAPNYWDVDLELDSSYTAPDYWDVDLILNEVDGLVIDITHPTNTSYDTVSVNLNWTNSTKTDWVGYSLNDANNVTLTTDIVMTATEGSNHVIVWGNDTSGTMTSDEVYFTVTTDSCTPPASGTWEIDSTSHCIVSGRTINIDYIYFTDSGTITFDTCTINVKAFERKSGDGGTWTDIIIEDYTNVTIDING